MIDTDEKKYVAELCAFITGAYPRDVVAYQGILIGGSSPMVGNFFIKSYMGTGTFMPYVNGNTFPSDEKQDMSNGGVSNRDFLGSGIFCTEVRIGPGGANHYVFAGYQCIM